MIGVASDTVFLEVESASGVDEGAENILSEWIRTLLT